MDPFEPVPWKHSSAFLRAWRGAIVLAHLLPCSVFTEYHAHLLFRISRSLNSHGSHGVELRPGAAGECRRRPKNAERRTCITASPKNCAQVSIAVACIQRRPHQHTSALGIASIRCRGPTSTIRDLNLSAEMGSIGLNSGFTPPAIQRAIIVESGDHVCVRDDTPLPPLQEHEFMVRTDALAIQPSDTKMRGDFVTPGAMLGIDYAGTVVACGPAVTGVEIGDRVCGAQHEMNAKRPYRAAFGEYNIPTGPFWLKLPAFITTEGGATMSTGIGTAGLTLNRLGLLLPDAPVQKPAHVLVYGGGTASATIVIQLLKL